MNTTISTILIFLASINSGRAQQQQDEFKSKRVSQTASFEVNTDTDTAFPLFGAFEEQKWEPDWKPVLIYPDEEIIEEGTTFKVYTSNDQEPEYLWVVSKYDAEEYLIQYLVSTANRFWTITVQCASMENEASTEVTVTYTFTSLNELGNALNRSSLERMYKNNLQDWAKAINSYLEQ